MDKDHSFNPPSMPLAKREYPFAKPESNEKRYGFLKPLV
jgi:hypothetical protein